MHRIGILGGTFDPFHNQHLNIAKAAYQKLKLAAVWILPTKQNPLKKQQISATNAQRIAMINLAIKDYPWLKLNDYELTTKGTNYTINTIQALKHQYPQYQFFFIIGSDNLATLQDWKAIDTLITLTKLVVVNRPHYRKTITLMQKYHCHNLVVRPSSAISSSKIRNGQVIDQLDLAVNDYINDNLLYVQQRLQFNLDQKRVQHSLNVAAMAQKLAIKHQVDHKKAQIAGIYHDLSKQWSKPKMTNYLLKYQPAVLNEPFPVWHGYVAAWYLQHHYHFKDQTILQAIAKHTTGAILMSTLELVVFLADKISIERNYREVETLRQLAFEDLTLAFKFYLTILKKQLLAKKQPLNQQFLTIYDWWHQTRQE